ncbi:hypothetical protein LJN57_017930, partial [Cellulomonas sp. zg-Y766]|nr:hypothetical protein [Cellulomonas wangsupingiae]
MSGRQDTGARRQSGQDGTTGTAAPAPAPPGASAADATPPVAVGTAPGTAAPLIPTQAGHAVSAPVPVVPARLTALPTQSAPPALSAPVPVVADTARTADGPAAQRAARPHGRQIVALLTAAGVLVSAGGVWAVQQDRALRADMQRAAQSRVDGAVTALAPELSAGRADGLAAGAAVAEALRADAGASGRAAVDHANATLAASAQAGDGPRGALQAAIGGAAGALDAPAVSLTTLRTTTAALAAPERAVVDAQAAWQAAENARLAAEAAAAQA